MNVAATRIQAAYRGHSVRQGLNWRLPSGHTLGDIMRKAQHHKPGTSQAGAERLESSQISTTWDTVVHKEEPSLSEELRSYSISSAHTISSVKVCEADA